jgi:hypothetical protein
MKIPTTIVAITAFAALSIPAGASAAMLVRAPGTVAQSTAVQTTIANKPKEVGSVGNPGFDNAKCEELLHTQISAEAGLNEAAKEGDKEGVRVYTTVAEAARELLEDNCLIVD